MDEVQTGIGRTGKLMGYMHDLGDDVRPDITTLGKALSGGMTPVSGILANHDVLSLIGYGEHGSTFGGNPLGMAVAKAAVTAVIEEGMIENAEAMGNLMMKNLKEMNSPVITDVRGRGLLMAIEFDKNLKHDGTVFSQILFKNGLLARASYQHMMRFSPALIVTESEINESCEIIHKSLKEFEAMNTIHDSFDSSIK